MAAHSPPAPDWVLGDDGHWRPPPFPTGGGSPAGPSPWAGPTDHRGPTGPTDQSGPTGPTGPPAGPPPGGSRAPVGLTIVVVLLVLLAGAAGAVVLTGGDDGDRATALDPADTDPADTDPAGDDGAVGTGRFVPVDPSGPAPTAPSGPFFPALTGTPGADPADHCPTPEEAVAAAGEAADFEISWDRTDPTTFTLNGMQLVGSSCSYSSTISVARLPVGDAEAAIDRLLRSRGDFRFSDGGLDLPSARAWRTPDWPGATGSDIVRGLYVAVGDDVYYAGGNGLSDEQVDALAALVLARAGAA